MQLNKAEKAAYKKIVTLLARSCREIQEELWRNNKIPRDSIWLIGDLKQQIWRDYSANPEIVKIIRRFQAGKIRESSIKATEDYAKSLSDLVTPATAYEYNLDEQQPKTKPNTNKPKPKVSSKSPSEKILEVGRNWNNANVAKQEWAKRYKVIREVLYRQLPNWKKDTVDSEPDHRVSGELARSVWKTAESFDEVMKLISSLDENPIPHKLRLELIMLVEYEGESCLTNEF